VSKSPAKKAPARSKAAGKGASARTAAKPAAKPKAPAKPVKTSKPSAKPVGKAAAAKTAKPAAKLPPKSPAKPPSKSAPKAAPKSTVKPAAHKPATTSHKPLAKDSRPGRAPALVEPTPKVAAPKPAVLDTLGVGAAVLSPSPVPTSALPTLAKTSDRPQASPAATAAGSRFTERFAPPRPPQRTLPEPVEPVRPTVKADPRLVNAWKNKSGRDLTEDELLAMPDAEYMNDKQLEFFRTRLQALKDDLLSNAGETTEHLREDTSIVPDPADRATIEEEHALELRTRDRERKLLKKITQSLARIEAGDYGYCDETGEPIGLGRLLARPTATLSLEAQQRRELKQKMFGD
jgi:DnaK suppressor protein